MEKVFIVLLNSRRRRFQRHNFFACMKNGGVIAATKVAANLLEAVAGVATRQPHADLPGRCNGLVASSREQVSEPDVVVHHDRVQDVLDGQVLRRGRG